MPTKDSYSSGSYAREIKTQKSRWEIWLNDTENAPQVSAPNLTHFGLRNTIAAGIKEFSKENPENLINWIEDPSSITIISISLYFLGNKHTQNIQVILYLLQFLEPKHYHQQMLCNQLLIPEPPP